MRFRKCLLGVEGLVYVYWRDDLEPIFLDRLCPKFQGWTLALPSFQTCLFIFDASSTKAYPWRVLPATSLDILSQRESCLLLLPVGFFLPVLVGFLERFVIRRSRIVVPTNTPTGARIAARKIWFQKEPGRVMYIMSPCTVVFREAVVTWACTLALET